MEQKIDIKARLLLFFFVAWGAMIFWIAPHPPMVDFPQHAAQISLLKELLTGNSPWSGQLQINLVTPYLIGYGLATLLSFLMPIVTAMKLLLSLAYILFVAVCIRYRKRVSADSRLDWIFIPTFFGFCYSWGLYTFLLAAPIGLYFILQAERYASRPTIRRGAVVIAIGLLLLISHGMTFVLGWGTGLTLLTLRMRQWKALTRYLPYAILLLAGYIFYESGKQIDATLIQSPVAFDYGTSMLGRMREAALFPFSSQMKIGTDRSFIPVVLAIFIAPFLLGLRLNWRHPAAWAPFVCVATLFFGLPNTADNTALLYSRYSLFLLPVYAWLFTSGEPGKETAFQRKGIWPALSLTILVLACSYVLGLTSLRVWRFSQETKEFDAKVRQLAFGHRALGLIFDPSSQAAENYVPYVHYTAWYQAENKGLTDFNFAWFTPQVVRYRPGAGPAVSLGFEWVPGSFDWKKHQGASYRYFFVRGKHDAGQLFRTAPCIPKVVIDSAPWKVYENCALSGGAQSN